MGCDIHVMVEVRRTLGKYGPVWCNADRFSLNPFYTYQKEVAEASGYSLDDDEREWDIQPIYDSRNYSLFAILSDVRNYGDSFTLGYDRKGFPKDADKITREHYEDWGCDAHTPGYCTLAELKADLASKGKIRHAGYVSLEEQRKFVEDGTYPTMWAQGVGEDFKDQFVWMEWEEDTKDKICSKLIEAIETRKREEFWIWDPEDDDFSKDQDIRIVFWYDN